MVAQTTGVVSALESWRSYLLGPPHMSAVERAGPVTRTNFAVGSYEKFQPGFEDQKRPKILGTSCGAKFEKQSKHDKTQRL